MPLELPPKPEAIHPLLNKDNRQSKCIERIKVILTTCKEMGTGSRQRISRTPSGAPPCQVTEAFTPQVLDTVSTTRRDSHLPPPSRGVCHTSNRFLLCNQMSTRERREGCGRNTHLSRNRLPLCSIPVPADGKTRAPSGRRCDSTVAMRLYTRSSHPLSIDR